MPKHYDENPGPSDNPWKADPAKRMKMRQQAAKAEAEAEAMESEEAGAIGEILGYIGGAVATGFTGNPAFLAMGGQAGKALGTGLAGIDDEEGVGDLIKGGIGAAQMAMKAAGEAEAVEDEDMTEAALSDKQSRFLEALKA